MIENELTEHILKCGANGDIHSIILLDQVGLVVVTYQSR
jgi:hypothetical protein